MGSETGLVCLESRLCGKWAHDIGQRRGVGRDVSFGQRAARRGSWEEGAYRLITDGSGRIVSAECGIRLRDGTRYANKGCSGRLGFKRWTHRAVGGKGSMVFSLAEAGVRLYIMSIQSAGPTDTAMLKADSEGTHRSERVDGKAKVTVMVTSARPT